MLSKSEEAYERTESPRHYPDNDLVMAYEVSRRGFPEVPAYGDGPFCAYILRNRARKIPNEAIVADGVLSNGRVMVEVREDGRVEFTDIVSKRVIPDLLRWESRVDLGDLVHTICARGEVRAEFRWRADFASRTGAPRSNSSGSFAGRKSGFTLRCS